MRLAQSLAHTANVFEPKTFCDFRKDLDPAWVLQALEDTGTVSVRRRRLPAEEMIWVVIGMALMRDRSIADIANMLAISRDEKSAKRVSSSAATQSRMRLGKQPLEWLFAQSASVWAHRSAAEDRFCGLSLYGLDGTSLRVPDSPQNAESFGYAHSVRGDSAYPMVRLVALMALRSHLLAGASFGRYGDGEYTYAEDLWGELPNNSLCIVDRNFYSAKLMLRLHNEQSNRHWLIRCKQKSAMRTLKKLGEGDYLVELKVSSVARKKDPTLPKTFTARMIEYQRKGFRPQRLLTSLCDNEKYKTNAIVALYHERWELELGYAEIKTQLLDRRESIRCKSQEGVQQEIWGMLLAYNLVRLYMQRVARTANLPPTRVSFIAALHFIREEWWLDSIPGFSPGSLPRHLQRLSEQMSRFILPERRSERSFPRAVKIKMSSYPRKRRTK